MSLDWNIDSSWSLFLDRDGVINERPINDYVLEWEKFHFRPDVLSSFSSLCAKFSHVFVVTNQQCVALNKISEIDLENIHSQMQKEISIKFTLRVSFDVVVFQANSVLMFLIRPIL